MICIRRDLDRHGTPIHPSIPEKLILMSDVTEESLDERVSIRFSFKSLRLEGNLKKGEGEECDLFCFKDKITNSIEWIYNWFMILQIKIKINLSLL